MIMINNSCKQTWTKAAVCEGTSIEIKWSAYLSMYYSHNALDTIGNSYLGKSSYICQMSRFSCHTTLDNNLA